MNNDRLTALHIILKDSNIRKEQIKFNVNKFPDHFSLDCLSNTFQHGLFYEPVKQVIWSLYNSLSEIFLQKLQWKKGLFNSKKIERMENSHEKWNDCLWHHKNFDPEHYKQTSGEKSKRKCSKMLKYGKYIAKNMATLTCWHLSTPEIFTSMISSRLFLYLRKQTFLPKYNWDNSSNCEERSKQMLERGMAVTFGDLACALLSDILSITELRKRVFALKLSSYFIHPQPHLFFMLGDMVKDCSDPNALILIH